MGEEFLFLVVQDRANILNNLNSYRGERCESSNIWYLRDLFFGFLVELKWIATGYLLVFVPFMPRVRPSPA